MINLNERNANLKNTTLHEENFFQNFYTFQHISTSLAQFAIDFKNHIHNLY